jgi:hypothetical protein
VADQKIHHPFSAQSPERIAQNYNTCPHSIPMCPVCAATDELRSNCNGTVAAAELSSELKHKKPVQNPVSVSVAVRRVQKKSAEQIT